MKKTASDVTNRSIVDDDDDFSSSDDEDNGNKVFLQRKINTDRFDVNQDNSDDEEEEDENDNQEDDDEESNNNDNLEDDDLVDPNDDDDDDLYFQLETQGSKGVKQSDKSINKKLKKLTPHQLEKEEKKIKKTGVCYMSRIPPYMKPATLRSIMSRFGRIDRLFLKPEDTSIYHKRVKYGGNKKKNFTEGWIEFVNKKDAKMCASTLNGNKLGGKKTSYYYDDVINMKYLSGFKWFDLTQQIAKENEIRQARLALELSQQQKLNKSFVNNVEKSKMISNIQRKRKEKEMKQDPEKSKVSKDEEIRRNFKQRKVTSTRADAETSLKENSKPNDRLNSVLSKVF
ncbi:putative pre-rRNA-processing protein [Scheffersomyces coipomensis]|uniref:putative pre-rRNA-processing protein n=1 Tax=Scheffersomyces coipomensis TaxID=1788519 RepID=UPI00315CF092